jgi:hypothetical protein
MMALEPKYMSSFSTALKCTHPHGTRGYASADKATVSCQEKMLRSCASTRSFSWRNSRAALSRKSDKRRHGFIDDALSDCTKTTLFSICKGKVYSLPSVEERRCLNLGGSYQELGACRMYIWLVSYRFSGTWVPPELRCGQGWGSPCRGGGVHTPGTKI